MSCPHRDKHRCKRSIAPHLLVCRWLVGRLPTDDARYSSLLSLRALRQAGVYLHALRPRPNLLRRRLRFVRSAAIAARGRRTTRFGGMRSVAFEHATVGRGRSLTLRVRKQRDFSIARRRACAGVHAVQPSRLRARRGPARHATPGKVKLRDPGRRRASALSRLRPSLDGPGAV